MRGHGTQDQKVPVRIRQENLNFYVAFVDDTLRAGHHETIGVLIRGTRNDRGVRCSLGLHVNMAVSACTYGNLSVPEQQAFPNDGHLVAARVADAKALWPMPYGYGI